MSSSSLIPSRPSDSLPSEPEINEALSALTPPDFKPPSQVAVCTEKARPGYDNPHDASEYLDDQDALEL